MDCPQCHKQVPARLSWVLSGANASTCPHCKVSLCPRATCAIVLFLLSCVLADGTLILLRHVGAGSWIAFAAFFVVFAAAYLLGLRVILRLRVKTNAPRGLDPSNMTPRQL
jgi:hypothetical protein